MTSRPVRLGVQVQPQHATYAKIRETVQELEQLGVDILFNWDHFFPLYGDPDGLHFEAWTELGSWAELTSRVEFGTLVNCNSYRGADLQADMARTLDHISGGRFIFGTGSGWFERDYDEYGYEFGTAGQRLDALGEALPRIEARWGVLNPPPTRKIPVLIGGGGEKKTLKLVAKHATIWHSFSDVPTLQHKLEVLKAHAADVGRDVSEIEISNDVKLTGAFGSADAAVLDEKAEVGVSLFTLGITGPSIDLGPVKDLLAWRDEKNA